jgi:hypothetical protein
MVASKAKPRGALVREDGRTHTSESLARVMRLPEPLIKTAIERLLDIGLLETSGRKPPKKEKLASHPDAASPQDAAPGSHDGAAEGKGTEHRHQEEKSKTKKRTERARDGVTSESPGATGKTPFPKTSADDDGAGPEVAYASPDDELKAIYQAKTAEQITIEVLDAIRANLEATGVGMSDFVVEVKKHVPNRWRNPPGFLRDLSKRFRRSTIVAGAPVTAAEAAERNYQCPKCHSRVRGQGAIFGDNKMVPCACASQEWIARAQDRGVFPKETTQ